MSKNKIYKKLTISDNLSNLMKERYYQPDENSPQDMIRRVSNFIAEGERQFGATDSEIAELSDLYFNTMNDRLWLPSSPFLMNAGTKTPMLSACFVVGGLEDSVNSIFETLKRTANIWKQGGYFSYLI